MAKVTKKHLDEIEEATKNDSFVFVNAKDYEKHIADGLIEINTELVDADGKVAARTTSKLGETVKIATATGFEIVKGLKPAPAKRGGERKEVYPFSELEVGDTFLIEASEKYPEPAKQLASTVSAAGRRFATESGETKTNKKGNVVPILNYTRKFVIRPVTPGMTYDSGFVESKLGARVFRVE
jgi:hypothetical protein